MPNQYKCLNKQGFSSGEYFLVPIRMEDRYDIMRWRNEQMYHLRQNKPLTGKEQDNYFQHVVAKLFDQDQPQQILFSYLHKDKCIGYGGLVHINWIDRNAEISFIMDTALENESFQFHWINYLKLLERAAFDDLKLHKIYTYAYDIRLNLYPALKKAGFFEDAILKDHCFFDGKFTNVRFHSKIRQPKQLRKAVLSDLEITYKWAADETVRRYSFSQDKITFEEHRNWFNTKIKNKNCYYYIFENDKTPVGSIRFDVDQNDNAMISYLIDPLFHGKGFGKDILNLGVEQLLNDNAQIKTVFGHVMEENNASIRIFETLGYKQSTTNEKQLRFDKEIP